MEVADGINRLMEIGCECGEGIPSEEGIALVFRAYVEPATKVGPAWGEVILDQIFKFTPRRDSQAGKARGFPGKRM
jgi:hypothetical protein